ncbi:MAG: carboxypeptidase regulatory-like domain-containing protein [Candidatus Hydrogenedentes bacterium]|nr:carboxypeptidase regulatory-like domain-containing protein [Candidatus Hydrogenedentota bacterium]
MRGRALSQPVETGNTGYRSFMTFRAVAALALAAAVSMAGALASGEALAPLPRGAGPRTGTVLVLEVTLPDLAAVDELTRAGYNVGHLRGTVATVHATPDEAAALRAAGYALRETARQPAPVSASKASASKALGVYHSYEGMTAILQDYATAYGAGQSTNPDLCRLTSLGQSEQGRELWALLITDNPDIEEDEPEFKYIGTMHGDEALGMELCLYLIDRLLSGYGTDSQVTALVDDTAIWIVPLMNPDGHAVQSRYNALGYDLNRSFPIYPDDYTGNLFDDEPLDADGRPAEVVRVMEWTAANSFVLAANLHTGELVVNYPYDEDGVASGDDAPTPDDLLFEDVSRRYSIHNAPMWGTPFFDDGITNGSAWYAVFGSMQDWNYRYASCNEVTIELSRTERPDESEIPTYWADNETSMLSYLEAVHIGVRGLVTSAYSGAPLWAKVTVHDNAHHVFTDADVGDYHRMLLPGTYTLTFTADGHYPATVEDVVVVDGAATRLDVALTPLPYSADVDGDGDVDSVDIQYIVNAALGLTVPYDCDLNENGAVDAVDVQLALFADLLL